MVSQSPRKSIRPASHDGVRSSYHRSVAKKPAWKDWGPRFRELSQQKGLSTRRLAESLELAESTVRSWLNGNREINLTDFFLICQVGNIDPAAVLFGTADDNFIAISRAWAQADDQGKRLLSIAAEAVLKEHEQPKRGTSSTDR